MLSRYSKRTNFRESLKRSAVSPNQPPPVGDILEADDPRGPEQAQQIEAFYRELGQRGEVEGDLNGQTVDAYEAARASELIQWAEFCPGEMQKRPGFEKRPSRGKDCPQGAITSTV